MGRHLEPSQLSRRHLRHHLCLIQDRTVTQSVTAFPLILYSRSFRLFAFFLTCLPRLLPPDSLTVALPVPPPVWLSSPIPPVPTLRVFTDGSFVRETGSAGASAVFLSPSSLSLVSAGDATSALSSFHPSTRVDCVLSAVPSPTSSTHPELFAMVPSLLAVAAAVSVAIFSDSTAAISVASSVRSLVAQSDGPLLASSAFSCSSAYPVRQTTRRRLHRDLP